MPELPPILTAEDFAEYFNLKTKYVYRLCREGRLAHIKFGPYYRIPRQVALDYERTLITPAALKETVS